MRWSTPLCLVAFLLAACGDDDSNDTDADAATGGAGMLASGSGGDAADGGVAGTGGAPAAAGAGGAAAGRGGGGRGGAGSSGSAGVPAAGRAGGAGTSMAGMGAAGSGMPSSKGLRIEGNRILTPDGKPFHGRGANLADSRSCDACSFMPADVPGLNRWADALTDGWKANFVRFTLWSFASSGGRTQWKSILADPSYLADIENTVSHMTSKAGVYVLVTLFLDPSIKQGNVYDAAWPTAQTIPVYEALAEAFADDPKVLFGLTNEPHGPADRNPELAQRYLDSIDAIRAVEKKHGAPEHVIVVQAPQQWARYLDYFVQNPIARSNVAYEVHAYNPQSDFDKLLTQPSKKLPILIGEYGPSEYSSNADITAMWQLCKQLEIPHIAWTFHMRCDPNLLQNTASDGCGLSASTGYNFPRTAWGDMLYAYLAVPW